MHYMASQLSTTYKNKIDNYEHKTNHLDSDFLSDIEQWLSKFEEELKENNISPEDQHKALWDLLQYFIETKITEHTEKIREDLIVLYTKQKTKNLKEEIESSHTPENPINIYFKNSNWSNNETMKKQFTTIEWLEKWSNDIWTTRSNLIFWVLDERFENISPHIKQNIIWWTELFFINEFNKLTHSNKEQLASIWWENGFTDMFSWIISLIDGASKLISLKDQLQAANNVAQRINNFSWDINTLDVFQSPESCMLLLENNKPSPWKTIDTSDWNFDIWTTQSITGQDIIDTLVQNYDEHNQSLMEKFINMWPFLINIRSMGNNILTQFYERCERIESIWTMLGIDIWPKQKNKEKTKWMISLLWTFFWVWTYESWKNRWSTKEIDKKTRETNMIWLKKSVNEFNLLQPHTTIQSWDEFYNTISDKIWEDETIIEKIPSQQDLLASIISWSTTTHPFFIDPQILKDADIENWSSYYEKQWGEYIIKESEKENYQTNIITNNNNLKKITNFIWLEWDNTLFTREKLEQFINYNKDSKDIRKDIASYLLSWLYYPSDPKIDLEKTHINWTNTHTIDVSDINDNSYDTLSKTEKWQYIYNHLIWNTVWDKKLTRIQALAVLWNLQQESNFKTDALWDNWSAHGIAQRRNERFKNLKEFASEQWKDRNNITIQIWFLKKEIHQEKVRAWHTNHYNTFHDEVSSLEQKTEAFDRGFERSNWKSISARISHANTFNTLV